MEVECGECTNVMRDGIWVEVSCTEPVGHPGEAGHYDRVFSYEWLKRSSDEGALACL